MALFVRCQEACFPVTAKQATVSREWANGFRERCRRSGECAGALEKYLKLPVKLLVTSRLKASAGMQGSSAKQGSADRSLFRVFAWGGSGADENVERVKRMPGKELSKAHRNSGSCRGVHKAFYSGISTG